MESNEIKVVEGQIVTSAKFNKAMKSLQAFQIRKQEMDNREKEAKQALHDAMTACNITHFENEMFSISIVPAGTRVSADSAKLKKDGLFEKYSKETQVKASTRITWKDSDATD